MKMATDVSDGIVSPNQSQMFRHCDLEHFQTTSEVTTCISPFHSPQFKHQGEVVGHYRV